MLCHKALPRTSGTREKRDDALLVGGSLAHKTALCNREEGQEPPGVTPLQNPPGRERQRKERFRHGSHTASSMASVLWAPPSQASLRTLGTSSQHPCKQRAAPGSCLSQLVQELERLLLPSPTPSHCNGAQWHHSATELLLVSSAAQKASLSTSAPSCDFK